MDEPGGRGGDDPPSARPRRRVTRALAEGALVGADFSEADELRTQRADVVRSPAPASEDDDDGESTVLDGEAVALPAPTARPVAPPAAKAPSHPPPQPERRLEVFEPREVAQLQPPDDDELSGLVPAGTADPPDATARAPAVVVAASETGAERDRSSFLAGLGRSVEERVVRDTPPPRVAPSARGRATDPPARGPPARAPTTPPPGPPAAAELGAAGLRGITGFHAVVAAPAAARPADELPTWTWAQLREIALGLALVVLLVIGAFMRRSAEPVDAAVAAPSAPADPQPARPGEAPVQGPLITVASEPPDAVVLLEGAARGLTPLVLTASSARGPLRVRVERPGFQAWEGLLPPGPDGHYTLSVELPPDPQELRGEFEDEP